MAQAEAEIARTLSRVAGARRAVGGALSVPGCEPQLKLGQAGQAVTDEQVAGVPALDLVFGIGLTCTIEQAQFDLPAAPIENARRRALAGTVGAEIAFGRWSGLGQRRRGHAQHGDDGGGNQNTDDGPRDEFTPIMRPAS